MNIFSIAHHVADPLRQQYIDGDRLRLGRSYDLKKVEIGDKVTYYVNGRQVSRARWCGIHWKARRAGQGIAIPPECRGAKKPKPKPRPRPRPRRRKARPNRKMVIIDVGKIPPPIPQQPPKKHIKLDCYYPLERSAYERLKKHITSFDTYIEAKPTKHPDLVCLDMKKWKRWPVWALPAYFVESGLRANRLAALRDHLAMRASEDGIPKRFGCTYFAGKRLNCKKPKVYDIRNTNCGQLANTKRGRRVCKGLIDELQGEADRSFWVSLLEFGGLIVGLIILKILLRKLMIWLLTPRRDNDDGRIGGTPSQPTTPQPVAPEPKVQPTAADWNAMAPQPTAAEWNAMAPPAPVPTPTLTPEPKGAPVNPTDWNAMIAPRQSNPQGSRIQELQELATHIDDSILREKGMFEVKSGSTSLLMTKQGDMYVQGLDDREAIAVAYYAMKEDMLNGSHGYRANCNHFTDYFLHMVMTKAGIELSFDEQARDFGEPLGLMTIEQLFNRVSLQLEHGYDLFNLEATLAHIGGYFRLKADGWHDVQRQRMDVVMEHLMDGHFDVAYGELNRMFDDIKGSMPGSQHERALLSGLLGLSVAEMAYRHAVCATGADDQNHYLREAELNAYDGRAMIYNHELPGIKASCARIGSYAGRIGGQADVAVTWLATDHVCNPTGVHVAAYGPTSASVAERSVMPTGGIALRIVPLTPIKMVGR